MKKQKSHLSRFLSIPIIFLVVLFFTVFANNLSIQEIGIHAESRVFSGNLTSAFAQSPNPNEFPSPTQSSSPTATSENDEDRIKLNSQDILILLLVVLIGALVLLFALLSPITGLLGFRPSEEGLKSKAAFLTEAFPSLLQGVTVILIVMIVTILTLAGWIESQGTISILSALIGYVLGRKATELEYQEPPKVLRDPVETNNNLNENSKTVETETNDKAKRE